MNLGHGYQSHPLADAIPFGDVPSLNELARDIRASGLLEPIVIFEGKVLDGRRRLVACLRAGVEPRFVDYTGKDPQAFLRSKNLLRRQLTEAQQDQAGADLKALEPVKPWAEVMASGRPPQRRRRHP